MLGPLRGFEPRSAAYETAILPVELQRHASAPKRRFFCFLGKYPGPRISRNFTREGAAVAYPSCPGIGSPPRGAHFSMAKRESRPRQSGCPAPRVCLGGGGGAVSAACGATFGRSGGARRAEAGAGGRKSRTRGGSGGPGGVRGRRGPGQNRGQPGLHPGARRAKNGRRRGKTGRSGGQKAGLAGAGGAKSPLFAPNGAGGGLCGRETGGKSWRRV